MSDNCCTAAKDYEICYELLYRMRQPVATVLCSGIPIPSTELYDQAYSLGGILVREGYSVLTGGGPGAMNAVNQAAKNQARKDDAGLVSTGIRVHGIDDDFECPSCQESVAVHSFGVRKHFLLAYCNVCVVLPGGVGTADELWHLLNYIKHGRTICQKVLLMPPAFWGDQMHWLHAVIKEGLADPQIAAKLISTDISSFLDYLVD